jgi:IS4 transposase
LADIQNRANEKGLVVAKEERIVFEKGDLRHESRKVEIWEGKKQPVVLLTNNFEFSIEDLREIYRRRWAIEMLYKQLKQNFPLHFFYGDTVNAIQIQTWVVLIANLLCTVIERKIKRHCSFSQIVTMVRQTLMYYIDFVAFMENPNRSWQIISEEYEKSPPKIVQYSLNFG